MLHLIYVAKTTLGEFIANTSDPFILRVVVPLYSSPFSSIKLHIGA